MMDSDRITTTTVVGAGTMGAIIAWDLARIGKMVRLVDVAPDLLGRGRDIIAKATATLVACGRIDAAEAAKVTDSLTLTTDTAAAYAGTDFVVECASERLDVKQAIVADFESRAPAHALFASNTSGLPISQISAKAKRPQQVAGMHFWNPPHIIPLVEVTMGERTSADTADTVMGVARQLGKRPVLVKKDVPGIIGNRIQFAVVREALHLLAEGVASAEDIDTAVSAGPGLRWALFGPLRIADLGGLDVFQAISAYLWAELSDEKGASALLTELVAAGRLGAKSGRGIYDYGPDEIARTVAKRDRVLLALRGILEAPEG